MTSLRELIAATAARMRVDFDQISKQASHMGERGRAREDVLRDFLQKYLPGRVGVGEGVIIDHTGAVSQQCDIVLYDKQSTPVFWLSKTVRLFPAETVLMVLQVKSNLTKRELKSALDNIASVARLARSGDPAEPLVAGYTLSSLFDGDVFQVNYKPGTVPGGIFAYDSPRLETLLNNVSEAIRGRGRHEWPIIVVSLAEGSVVYAKEGPDGHEGAYPPSATLVVGWPPEENDPLLMLYLMLMDLSQKTLVARPNLWSYARVRGRAKSIPIGGP